MKLLNYILLAVFVLVFAGCKDADPFTDVVYFTGTESSPVVRYSVEEPTNIGLSVTASCKVEAPVHVKFTPASNLVDAYNQKEGTKYKMLPENCYKFESSDFTIEAGQHISSPVALSITNLEEFEEEVTYLLPVSLVQADGLDILTSSQTIYIVISRPIITTAPSISGTYFQVPFENDPSLGNLTHLTLEARVMVNQFANYNPYISTVFGIEGHFLLRFGDVTIKPNQIQVAGSGVETTAPTLFDTGKWYHVAAVYDSKTVKIYINGKLDVNKAAAGTPINLGDYRKFYIGRSEGGRLLNGAVSEARVWKKALTQKEIVNNMCGVDPMSEGLVAYWRMNEGTGKDLKDWTGHGWDTTSSGWGNLNWLTGVRCPE